MNARGVALWWATGAVLALAACSGAGTGSATHLTAPSLVAPGEPPGLGKDPQRVGPAPPVPGARTGGTLTVLSDYGLPSLDPSNAYYTSSISILSGLLVRSLTQYSYDPASGSMILVPDLATDLGRPSHHFTRWEFTLRSGIRYENGRRVTPADLKYGIERSFDRSSFPEGAPYTNDYFLDGESYAGPYRSVGDYRGVTIDGRTLTLRMSRPFPDLPYYASFPAISPIPPGKASDPATYQNHPWATGPYMIADQMPGHSLSLVRNPYWEAATDPGRHQYVDGFTFEADRSADEIDAIMRTDTSASETTISMDSISGSEYQRLDPAARERLVRGPGACTFLRYPDYRTVTDIAVRRALGYAYPYRAAWRSGGLIVGLTVLPATSLLPPVVVGRVPYDPLPGHDPGGTDPAKARSLLEASGHLGYPIRFAYPYGDPDALRLKHTIVRALTAAGFRVTAVRVAAATMSSDFLRNPDADVNLRSVGWCADWPTGSTFIPQQFGSTDLETEGFGNNFAAFSEPRVDARIAAIQRLPLERQPAAWNALDRLIQTRYFPAVATGYSGVAMMRGSLVNHDFVDSVYMMPTWKDLWLG